MEKNDRKIRFNYQYIFLEDKRVVENWKKTLKGVKSIEKWRKSKENSELSTTTKKKDAK